eukprot:Gregarina_sp_Poly_1__10254@NODE_715_length_6637_cov_683_296347_g363_i1_p2_GENE_NODE_715_length_6637_cov_683_296347_g363_i1NODE_715_length_6637_cov_683_296347_g363_i1_p2_ORF_typecomplete_len424_score45_80_NODE_715_length_6637_cov_683_296347_g363_i111022373
MNTSPFAGEWSRNPQYESHVPTPRPALAARYQWGEIPRSTFTPRLAYQAARANAPVSTPPSAPAPRNVTPLKRAPEVWPYLQPQPLYTPLGADPVEAPYSTHYRAHTPPPGTLSALAPAATAADPAPIFGYRALALTRSVTPPPCVSTPSLDATPSYAPGGTPGWISMSTADMSPFTVLRIKALIELCAIPSQEDKVIATRVTPPQQNLKSCLRVKKSKEQIEIDNEVLNEDFDVRATSLLNHLLEFSRLCGRIDPLQVLYKVNEEFNLRQKEDSSPLLESSSPKQPRLNFSPVCHLSIAHRMSSEYDALKLILAISRGQHSFVSILRTDLERFEKIIPNTMHTSCCSNDAMMSRHLPPRGLFPKCQQLCLLHLARSLLHCRELLMSPASPSRTQASTLPAISFQCCHCRRGRQHKFFSLLTS